MAIILGNDEIREVTGISEDEKKDIFNFLQGAVYCWCKNRKDEWFSMRDLMGGDNYYWEGTPLIVLYDKHNNAGSDDPIKSAGKDSGWLLKKVIKADKREFETKEESFIRIYKWKS